MKVNKEKFVGEYIVREEEKKNLNRKTFCIFFSSLIKNSNYLIKNKFYTRFSFRFKENSKEEISPSLASTLYYSLLSFEYLE